MMIMPEGCNDVQPSLVTLAPHQQQQAKLMRRQMQRLVALWYHLQLAHGQEPFFLTSRDAAALLGVHYTTVF